MNCIELAERYRGDPVQYKREVRDTPGMWEYVLCRAYQGELKGLRAHLANQDLTLSKRGRMEAKLGRLEELLCAKPLENFWQRRRDKALKKWIKATGRGHVRADECTFH